MIDWDDLQVGLKTKGNTGQFDKTDLNTYARTLGPEFDEQYTDGLLVLAMAVVRQWIMDRKPVTEYPFVLPWIKYIEESMPNVYLNIKELISGDKL